MISIRTALVLAAFLAMGLTSLAETLVRTAGTGPDPSVSVGAEDAMTGKVLRLTQKAPALKAPTSRPPTSGTPAAPVTPDLSPWI